MSGLALTSKLPELILLSGWKDQTRALSPTLRLWFRNLRQDTCISG